MPWDLVIFDEAHRLRNVYKRAGSARAKALRDAVKGRFKVMLTATPLQNSLMELYGLVSVIDNQFFGDERTFKTMYEGRYADAATLVSLRRRLEPIYKRHLRRDVQEAGHVSFTRREATTFDFEPSDLETELYEKVSAYLQRPDSIAFGLHPNQLVIIQARKILGSSVAAIIGFLQTVCERLRRHQTADMSTVADVGDADELAEEQDEAAILAGTESAVEPPEDEEQSDTREIDPVTLKAEFVERCRATTSLMSRDRSGSADLGVLSLTSATFVKDRDGKIDFSPLEATNLIAPDVEVRRPVRRTVEPPSGFDHFDRLSLASKRASRMSMNGSSSSAFESCGSVASIATWAGSLLYPAAICRSCGRITRRSHCRARH